jgi:hypothetical protein
MNSPTGTTAAPADTGPSDAESFRLVSIKPARHAPSGSVGRDWLVYSIAQGVNLITGYRQGDLAAVTADVERIVVSLNERQFTRRARERPKHGRTAAKTVVAAKPVAPK